jgi:putative phosphoribosyl transferase
MSLLVLNTRIKMTEFRPEHNRIENIVRIPVQTASNKAVASTILEGNLTIPDNLGFLRGIIVFALGSSDCRLSHESKFIAQALNKEGLATLLVDLLSKEEEETDIRTTKIRCKLPGLIPNKFNIKLLSDRLIRITDWLLTTPYVESDGFVIGFFGSNTGAAAALAAASERPALTSAVVSWNGTLDLISGVVLMNIRVPTLLVVGGNDDNNLIGINNNTIKQLCNVEEKKLVVVPGTSSLFEKPSALENLTRLAISWFRCYFLVKQHDNQK